MTGKERHRTIQEEFFCPEDARPGDVIGVTTEAGSTAEVVIPDGVECGEAFLANVEVPAEWARERMLELDVAAVPHVSDEAVPHVSDAQRRQQEDEAYLRQLEDQEAAAAAQRTQAVANAKAEARALRASWECECCPGVRAGPSQHQPITNARPECTDGSILFEIRCAVCGSLAPDPDDWKCLLPEAMRRTWGWSPWLDGGAKDVNST